MTRRQKRTPRKKKGGGVLMGMRSGVQKVAGAVTGGGDDDKDEAPVKTAKSKVWAVASNVLSGALVLAAGAVLLHRCGILKF